MILINNVTKKFDDVVALDRVSFNIGSGTVFGLIGSNGSGKSTLLRIISGVFEPNGGSADIDGEPTYENPSVKAKSFFVPDFPFFYNNSTIENTALLYRGIYPNWDEEYYKFLCQSFPVDPKKPVISMSKGMQRQAALILALSTRPKYLLLDEIFDGLDPVVRRLVKNLIITNVTDNNMTAVIASHNLRELEDICDHVGILHRGGVIMERELDESKLGIHKVQLAFTNEVDESIFDGLHIISMSRRGNLFSITVRGEKDEVTQKLEALSPAFMETLPLTLEEVFINEMEGAGYDINNIL